MVTHKDKCKALLKAWKDDVYSQLSFGGWLIALSERKDTSVIRAIYDGKINNNNKGGSRTENK